MRSTIFSLFLILVLCSCAGPRDNKIIVDNRSANTTENSSKITKPKRKSRSVGLFKVGNPYKVAGKTYTPRESYNHTETGIASWYGPNFHGKPTANGERFDMHELTAAHRTLQIPSLVRVTNLENGKSLIVRVNDRGPFKRGRIIDLSKKAAELLGFKNKGVAKVKIQVLAEESRAIAMAAKRGEDTSGVEIAMNENRAAGRSTKDALPPNMKINMGNASRLNPDDRIKMRIDSKDGITNTALNDTQYPSEGARVERQVAGGANIPGHLNNGRFMPDPVIQEMPVGRAPIFVQVGSFKDKLNAQGLTQQLGQHGNAKVYSASVGADMFYRVRIGPINGIPNADRVLKNLIAGGYNQAIIVVE